MTKEEFLAEVRLILEIYKERLAKPGSHDIVIGWTEHDPQLVAIITDSYRRVIAHLESREVKPLSVKQETIKTLGVKSGVKVGAFGDSTLSTYRADEGGNG